MPEPASVLRVAITLDGKLADGTPDPAGLRARLTDGTVDEIHLTIRPRIDGRRNAPTLSGPPTPEFFPRSLALRLLGMETRDGECVLRYRVRHRARGA